MVNLNIGGVPEHFNYPWYLAFKDNAFKKHNINLRWKDCFGGTGEMCENLRNGEIDIAVILTEGIIKDITQGNPSKIVQVFVESPLIWGIHVKHDSELNSIEDLLGKTAAISRFGSGSHLMTKVNAYNLNWNPESLKFKVVQNLEGGISSISNNESDYFMWELFTTKPYVDSGIFKRIGTCPTPWPCFVIAVREEVLNEFDNEMNSILNVINDYTRNFKSINGLAKTLADRYDQKEEDIEKWLDQTEWNSKKSISKKLISSVQNKLIRYGVINTKQNAERFIKKM